MNRVPMPDFAKAHASWSATLATARAQRKLTIPKVIPPGLKIKKGTLYYLINEN
jgi:hypothetical protein